MGIQTAYIEVIIMPNDEVLHMGKSLGFLKNRELKNDFIDDGDIGGWLIKDIN